MRQRGKALYTADGQLGYDLEDLTDYFAFWFQMQEDGLTPPADLQAQAVASGKMEETMLVTGHALFDFIHSNQLVANQKLVPDELNITMIPNQKDGKPGQYLKPSMLISMATTVGRSGGGGEADELLRHRRSANDILLIERGVSGDASIRERIAAKLSDTEKKIIDYLDIVGDLGRSAAAAAAEECRRARPRAGSVPGNRSPSRRSTPAGGEGLLRKRQGRARTRLTEAPTVATTALGDDTFRGRRSRRRPPGRAHSPLLAAQRARLSFSHAVADRLLRPDARPDDRLALSVLHRLRSLTPARWAGLKNYEYAFFQDQRLGNALSVTFHYVIWSVPLKLTVALALAMALDRGIRGVAVYRATFYLPSLLGASVAIAMLWRQIFGADGLVNQLALPDARHLGTGLGHPSRLCALDARRAGDLAVRLADDHLSRGPETDSAGPLRGRVDGWRRAGAPVRPHHLAASRAGDLLQPRLPDHRGIQGVHAGLHRLGRHRRSGRLRRSSIRSTSTSRPSRISAWATPRRSPGCFSSSSASSRRSRS